MNSPACKFNLPKSVIVSGATGAIGSELCLALADNGVRIVAVARSVDKLLELIKRLPRPENYEHEYLELDFSDPESVRCFGEDLREKNIEIDGVVVNPPRVAPRGDSFPSDNDWLEVFQNVFLGPLNYLEHSVKQIRKSESEYKRIAVISGISSKQVLSHYSMNNVIRTAWAAQAKTLAFSLGQEGIHINTLSIGGLFTPAYKNRIQGKAADAGISFEEQMTLETENVPLRKYATIDETVHALIGILSGFTDHMTGVNFPFEGGYFPQY